MLVRVDADASPWHSTVHVQAPDRPGLLYELLLELASQRIDVRLARVGGEEGQANDLFHVTDAAGNQLDRAAADRLSTALAKRLIQAERGSPRSTGEREERGAFGAGTGLLAAAPQRGHGHDQGRR